MSSKIIANPVAIVTEYHFTITKAPHELSQIHSNLHEVPSLCMFFRCQSAHRQTHRHCIPHRLSQQHQLQGTCTPMEKIKISNYNVEFARNFTEESFQNFQISVIRIITITILCSYWRVCWGRGGGIVCYTIRNILKSQCVRTWCTFKEPRCG